MSIFFPEKQKHKKKRGKVTWLRGVGRYRAEKEAPSLSSLVKELCLYQVGQKACHRCDHPKAPPSVSAWRVKPFDIGNNNNNK